MRRLIILGSLGFISNLNMNLSQAAGFYVAPKGAVGIGLAHVGNAARASDGSTVFYNPAGMTLLNGVVIQGGADLIFPNINIINNDSIATTPGTGGKTLFYSGGNGMAGDPTPIPNIYYARPLGGGKIRLGISLTAPFGLALDYGKTWFGRYDSIYNKLTTINIAPAMAYRINQSWSIGGGINFEYSNATLTNALPNSFNPGGPTAVSDGLAKVKGDSFDVGYNIGILYHNDKTRLGFHYRSSIKHGMEGKTTISNLTGPLAGGNGIFTTNVDLAVPAIASIAVAHNVTDRLRLLAEMQWFGWSSFDEIRIEFRNGMPDGIRPQNFKDTLSAGVSFEYQWVEKWQWRSGILIDESPTSNKFRNSSIPDSNQIWYGIGTTFRPSTKWSVDLGYTHSDFESKNINLLIPNFIGTPAAGMTNVRGRTDNDVNVYSINVRYNF